MGGLILCRNIPVKHPYYVQELGLYLYTGEELSYYIYNHALLIPEEFPDEGLYPFLEEIGQGALAERIRSALSAGSTRKASFARSLMAR